MDQPTAVPTRKVAVSAMAGAAASVLAWALNEFARITLPAGLESAFAVLIMGITGYTVPNATPPVERDEEL